MAKSIQHNVAYVACGSGCASAGGDAHCSEGCIGCGACVTACPHGAIALVDGIARVDRSKCTGCGLCTKSCPTGTPAIRIADRKAVLGEIGGHYRLGWLPDDDPKNRRGDAPADAPEASAQGAGGLDYLNENAL